MKCSCSNASISEAEQLETKTHKGNRRNRITKHRYKTIQQGLVLVQGHRLQEIHDLSFGQPLEATCRDALRQEGANPYLRALVQGQDKLHHIERSVDEARFDEPSHRVQAHDDLLALVVHSFAREVDLLLRWQDAATQQTGKLALPVHSRHSIGQNRTTTCIPLVSDL
jgi:hypothetical protein